MSTLLVSRSFRLNRTLEEQGQLDISTTNDYSTWHSIRSKIYGHTVARLVPLSCTVTTRPTGVLHVIITRRLHVPFMEQLRLSDRLKFPSAMTLILYGFTLLGKTIWSLEFGHQLK